MKKILIVVSLLFLPSCIHYSDYKDTTSYSIDNSVKAKPLKTGTACVNNVLMLIAVGDSSVEAARRNGDITKVAFVDTSYNDFWFYYPFFQKGCTVVKGE